MVPWTKWDNQRVSQMEPGMGSGTLLGQRREPVRVMALMRESEMGIGSSLVRKMVQLKMMEPQRGVGRLLGLMMAKRMDLDSVLAELTVDLKERMKG